MVAAVSGAIGIVLNVLLVTLGGPLGTLSDIALFVMTLAIAPIMLGSYELGGVTPLWPARLSLAGGIGAVIVWSGIQAALILGFVTFDDPAGRSGVFAIWNGALIVIGAWLTGAPLLAGPWLPGRLRWLGALAGLGLILTGTVLLGGGGLPLAYIGGVGYLVLFPIWAFLVARVFRSRAAGRPGG